SGEGEPLGIFYSGASHPETRSYEITPILMAFRGFNGAMSPYRIPDLKPSGSTLPIDGAPCQEQVMKFANNSIESFWLDPTKDYVPRRIRNQPTTRLIEQADIHYRRHDTFGWVPDWWVQNFYSASGRVLTSTKVEVLEMGLNEPQPAEQFDIHFPVGC